MSTHPIIASEAEEAHLRQVLTKWCEERAMSRTAFSILLMGTDVLLPFWKGQRPLSQPILNRLLIGCRAAGIEATLDTLLGVRQPAPVLAQPSVATVSDSGLLSDRELLEKIFVKVARVEQLYWSLSNAGFAEDDPFP